MSASRHHRAAFSLVELLIAVAVVATLSAVLIGLAEPSLHDQLRGAAEGIAAELGLAQSLAIANNSSYALEFDKSASQVVLRHVGANPTLDAVPRNPFGRPDAPADQRITNLGDLPRLGAAVRIASVQTADQPPHEVDRIEFGPLGEMTGTTETAVWLVSGTGSRRRYVTVRVQPVTGLVAVGPLVATPPPVTHLASLRTSPGP